MAARCSAERTARITKAIRVARRHSHHTNHPARTLQPGSPSHSQSCHSCRSGQTLAIRGVHQAAIANHGSNRAFSFSARWFDTARCNQTSQRIGVANAASNAATGRNIPTGTRARANAPLPYAKAEPGSASKARMAPAASPAAAAKQQPYTSPPTDSRTPSEANTRATSNDIRR